MRSQPLRPLEAIYVAECRRSGYDNVLSRVKAQAADTISAVQPNVAATRCTTAFGTLMPAKPASEGPRPRAACEHGRVVKRRTRSRGSSP
jgi:hypothetical protein